MQDPADNFDLLLDRERLLQLYEDDTEMLISSIEMFLDEVIPSFTALENLIELKDWEGLAEQTHQLRPWLGMVGLTNLENKLLELEKLAKKRSDPEIIMNSCNNFNWSLEKMTPVLKTELQELTK
jgi:HPt (histidine-containing phosphotransfer) domain-containing protein